MLEHSPAPEPRRDWIVEIVNFRRDISDHLTGALRRDLKRQLPRLYEEVRSGPAEEASALWRSAHCRSFPGRCPYTLDQILGDFWPRSND